MSLRKNGFWAAGRFVIGIISINLSILVFLYLCIRGIGNSLAGGDYSGFTGLALAPCLLNAGLIGMCTRNSESKIGAIVTTVIYWIGTLFIYKELPALGVLSFLFGVVFLICAIKTKSQPVETVPLKKLIFVHNIFEKNHIIDTLKKEGIVAVIKPYDLKSILGELGLGEEVYVREMDYEQASKLMQELKQQERFSDEELETIAVNYPVEYEDHKEKDHRHHKIIMLVVILFVIYAIFSHFFNPGINWNDETLKWIVMQELNKNPEDNISMNDVAEITELYLDAEEIKTIKDLKHFSNLKVLELHTPNVDDLRPINELVHLEKLRLQELPITSIQFIGEIKSLKMVELEDINIDNLEVLKDLPNLSSVTIKRVKTEHTVSLNELERYQNISLSDLKVEGEIDSQSINTLSLENIDLGDRTDWLHADSLKHLTLNQCQIKDLAFLHALTGLESLNIARNPIVDLSPIQTLKNIEKLDLSGIDFTGKEELISDMKLKELRLSDCNITKIDFLQNQKDIIALDLSENPVRDLNPLIEWMELYSDAAKESIELNISGISLDTTDFLKSINFKRLSVKNCGLTDIEFLSSCKNLQYLDISDNQLFDSDIVPLLHMPQLREVCAKGNQITEGYILYGIKANWMKASAVKLSAGMYGCPVDWKNHYNSDTKYPNTWFRITID